MEDEVRATRSATIGELRRRLQSMGEPWTVPAHFTDEDPLPDLAPGGQPVEPGHVEGVRAVNTQEEFDACLREMASSNPFLATRWHELGQMDAATVQDAATGSFDGDVPEWGVG